MRFWILPLLAWAAALQGVVTPSNPVDIARLIGTAGVLGSLAVLVYRLGVWRQEMENTKRNVGAEVKAYREQAVAHFERIEARLVLIDRLSRRVQRLEQAQED